MIGTEICKLYFKKKNCFLKFNVLKQYGITRIELWRKNG